VGGAGEDGELRGREARKVPHNASAEQTKHLHRVLGTDDVGIPDDEKGGRVYRLYSLGGEEEMLSGCSATTTPSLSLRLLCSELRSPENDACRLLSTPDLFSPPS
jgi:hypothetical protein